ncbi:hypothetical protein FHR81_002178 [Actinoalloteichus hoggarensis]|uniref:Uncharacterized protein n=1 Tax=Actinoalloteichus hoggarensis TaxID=1470176 RepID=A0A221W5N4_9PSEU|nr:hypothetical protein [Actinoalloteichus hoggarensis]ASO21210.1 hypothetical protein AHOG_17925 [Actinoalloteichus hoggarensis]MBB5921140.1 hypothetical protein [Actinoalloteichus hoggarensis]
MIDQQASDERALRAIGLRTWSPSSEVFTAREPDETWPLFGGMAWVYRGEGNASLLRPVLLADGFDSGPSDLDTFWDGMDRRGFALAEALRGQGHDLILIGFDERSATVGQNARTVVAAIGRAIAERRGRERLVVGGFGVGAVVARYALAKLETDRRDHQTGVYLSYDGPHGGASVPIAVQAFAHYGSPSLAAQLNSPGGRQLLWRHIASVDGVPGVDALRTRLFAELDRVGGWPMRPRRLAVANGTGDGTGNGVPPGALALSVAGPAFAGTNLYTQSDTPDAVVATLQSAIDTPREVFAEDLPEIDGAPGGTLEVFALLGAALQERGAAQVHHGEVAFVPTLSALGFGEVDGAGDLFVDVSGLSVYTSAFDDFAFADSNTRHCTITEDLASWLLDRL